MRFSRRAPDRGGRPASRSWWSSVRDQALAPRRVGALALLLPVSTCAVFVLISDHVWEDYLITFRVSRNLVLGHGLVYVPGERVHAFTSFLNTLLPALFDWLTTGGHGSIKPALWLYRLSCAAALAGASWLMVRGFLRHPNHDPWSPLLFVVLLAFEIKTISFTGNGQEVAFMVLFVVWGLVTAQQGIAANWTRLGAIGAGLMYTRPDGFVYASVIAIATLAFTGADRRRECSGVLKAACTTVVLYLPWTAWVWCFYGTPVPNTIAAKRAAYAAPLSWGDPAKVVREALSGQIDVFGQAFEATYSRTAGWPAWVPAIMLLLGLAAAWVWVAPVRDRLMRTASLAFFLLCGYLAFVDLNIGLLFPWYLPATTVLGLVVLARIPGAVASRWPGAPESGAALASLLRLAVAPVFLGVFVLGTIQLTSQQAVVEEGVRKPVGLWLADHVATGQTVHLEPIGYIGFYSNAKLHDWPGLTSPEVIESRRRNNNDRAAVIVDLEPDWLVLRPGEFQWLFTDPRISASYHLVAEFDNSAALREWGWVPGDGYHRIDVRLGIFERRVATPAAERSRI